MFLFVCLLCFYRFSELLEAVLGDFLFNDRCDITSRTKEGFQTLFRFLGIFHGKPPIISIEFQLHTNSHIMLGYLWLNQRYQLRRQLVFASVWKTEELKSRSFNIAEDKEALIAPLD